MIISSLFCVTIDDYLIAFDRNLVFIIWFDCLDDNHLNLLLGETGFCWEDGHVGRVHVLVATKVLIQRRFLIRRQLQRPIRRLRHSIAPLGHVQHCSNNKRSFIQSSSLVANIFLWLFFSEKVTHFDLKNLNFGQFSYLTAGKLTWKPKKNQNFDKCWP